MRRIILIIAMIIAISMPQMAKDKVQFAQIIKIDTSMTMKTTGVNDEREIYPGSIDISKEEFEEICNYMIKYHDLDREITEKYQNLDHMCITVARVFGDNRQIKYIFWSHSYADEPNINTSLNYYESYLEREEKLHDLILSWGSYKDKDYDLKLNKDRIMFFRHMANFWNRLNHK